MRPPRRGAERVGDPWWSGTSARLLVQAVSGQASGSRAVAARLRSGSAERRRVLQPARRGPERIRAALDADRRQVAGEDLTVIADRLDDVDRPERCRGRASARVRRSCRGCAAPPAAGRSPSAATLAWVMPNSSALSSRKWVQRTTSAKRASPWRTPSGQRLLADDLGQDQVVVRLRLGRAGGGEAGDVGGDRRRSGRRYRRRPAPPAARSPPA